MVGAQPRAGAAHIIAAQHTTFGRSLDVTSWQPTERSERVRRKIDVCTLFSHALGDRLNITGR
jgi:hypothetical protein